MELAEVVSPHFAVPVFGVVLCAVLVFAFGFKSPVQPPSFDFGEDDRKKRTRQKKVKSTTSGNGHVVSSESTPPPATQRQASVQKSTPKQAKAENAPVKKEKVKKSTAKQVNVEVKIPKPVQNEEEDGEWTTAVHKKQRKNRSKKDDAIDTVIPPTKTPEPESPALEQRSQPRKERVSPKAKPIEVAIPVAIPSEKSVSPPSPVTVAEPAVEAKKQSEKSVSPPSPVTVAEPAVEAKKQIAESPKKGKKKARKTAKPAALDVSELEEGEIRDDSVLETSPTQTTVASGKAAQSGKVAQTKSKPSKPSPTEIKQGWEFVDTPPDAEAPNKQSARDRLNVELEEGEIVDDSIIEALQAASGRKVEASKPAASKPAAKEDAKLASPKKKKKSKESREKYQEDLTSSQNEPSQPQSTTSSSSKTSQLQSQSHSKSTGAAPTAQPSSGGQPAASDPPSAAVTFDELGDEWQEAKPVKKKKKARREN